MSSKLFAVTGKNVLVTGGSRGIGFMIASGFASAGANVLLTSRDENACREASKLIMSKTSSHVHYVASNVSTREGCRELAKHAESIFDGRLDVLVNNAGTSWGEDPYSRESSTANWGWDKVLNLNVKGMFYLSRECVPLLQSPQSTRPQSQDAADASANEKDAKRDVENNHDPGRIINIGSIAGMIPQETPTHAYDVSKAAVHHLSKKMSSDLAPRGITVNVIAPGYVPSRMTMGLSAWGADAKKIEKKIPLGRMGDEKDMAGAAIFLASRAGAWCTGVILNVDGGAVGATQIPMASL